MTTPIGQAPSIMAPQPGAPSTSAGRLPRPEPPPTAPALGAFSDPISVATAWARAFCPYDWHKPVDQQVVAAQQYLTRAGIGELRPTPADLQHWQSAVADQLVARCAITGGIVIPEAPRTRFVAYIQVHAVRYIDGPTARSTESITFKRRVVRDGDRWLVDKAFAAG